MEFTRPGEPAFGQGIHSVPGDAMRLAAPDHGPWPEPDHPFATDPEAVQVPRYRVVVEVALHHRLEPLPSLRDRIMHSLAQLLFIPRSFALMRLRIVLRLTLKVPSRSFPLMCGRVGPGSRRVSPGNFAPSRRRVGAMARTDVTGSEMHERRRQTAPCEELVIR
jgi:hypothetical protein